MQILYNIGILLLRTGIGIATIFNSKAKDWVSGRKAQFKNLPDTSGKKVIWFHCASLGEFDQGLPLMHKLKSEYPSVFLLVTFFSPSGMKFYKKREHRSDHVMYLPLDTKKNARRFMHHFKPTKAFFVKYEFWSNFIFEAKKSGSKIYNVSGIFRSDHRFFKWYGGFFRKTLRAFDSFFVQNEESKKLLESIGLNKVYITGDSRFDRVIENKKNATQNEIIAAFKNDEPLLIIGSSWPADEKIILPWINSQKGKVLIAPHNVTNENVNNLLTSLSDSLCYTKAEISNVGDKKVLILDTMGQLANAYLYGTIAYVGGGFSGKLHNILEPAVFGLPVIFGPKHQRFPEAQNFIDKGIGYSVDSTETFDSIFKQLTQSLEEVSIETIKFVEQNQGAANRIYTHITSS